MRRNLVLAATMIALAATSACGSPTATADRGPKVVAFVGSEVGPSASTPAQRPRERLATTPEEFEAMLVPFNRCLKERGYDTLDAKKAADRVTSGAELGPRELKLDEAYRVCEAQYYPLPPWERDPANPEAHDFAVAVVACLKGKGVEFVEVADDGLGYSLGGEDNDTRSIRRGMDLAPECEREVAAGK
jgi:hypothetical protein